MTHIHTINDQNGDIIDLEYFCSDTCHQTWCQITDTPYEGWNGSHENPYKTQCATCTQPL